MVDDNQGLAHILRVMLEDEGHEVRLARDGQDGYLTYLLFRPDVVITDIQMPGRNGLELMRLIRVYDPWVNAIYISCDLHRFGSLLEKERVRYRVGLLQKPFTKGELVRALSQLLS